jgi:cob(I)alamin adenosyltransferase
MQKLQRKVHENMAAATEEKGLLLVHTGPGKGKTTAALGMLLRALGHGFPCAVVQFIKGDQDTAETLLTGFAGARLRWDRVGEGFTWDSQDRDRDTALVRRGWEIVLGHLQDPHLKFLLLDELAVVLAYKYLDTAEVLEALARRRPDLHVVVTGRGAPQSLMDAADLVTVMEARKHPFQAGIKAQPGIEF